MESSALSIPAITGTLCHFVTENFLLEEGEVQAETPLVDSGLLDSVGIMELVSFVEETYGLEVDDRDLVPEHFGSVGQLARYVHHRSGERAQAG